MTTQGSWLLVRRTVGVLVAVAIVIIVSVAASVPSSPGDEDAFLGSGPPAGASPIPSAGLRATGPITVTSDDVTIDGVVVTNDSQTGTAIQAVGTAQKPIRNLTIRNCRISGFDTAIELRHVETFVIENCAIADADYAGIAVYSGIGGRILHNTIQRIGTSRTDFSQPFKQNNAYGITLDRSANGTLTTDPRSQNILVDGNLVTDVPLWMCMNTHAGQRITFSNNTTMRCPRGIFIAGDSEVPPNRPIDVTVSGNTILDAVSVPDGTDDLEAILISQLAGGAIVGNRISTSYGSRTVRDYLGESTGVTIGTQVVVP